MRSCGSCDFCEKQSDDLVCVNDQSEYLADFIETNHVCDDWSGSEEEE